MHERSDSRVIRQRITGEPFRPHRRDDARRDDQAPATMRAREHWSERALRDETAETRLRHGAPGDQPTEHHGDAGPRQCTEHPQRRRKPSSARAPQER